LVRHYIHLSSPINTLLYKSCQIKSCVKHFIPVLPFLRDKLDSTERKGIHIVLNNHEQPWSSEGFQGAFAKAKKKAGIENLTFHDLRGTCATRLKEAGASIEEISEITGHTIQEATSILQTHYLGSTPVLAISAMEKLETKRKQKL